MNATPSILLYFLLSFLPAASAAAQPQAVVDDVLYPLAIEEGADAALARFQSVQQTSNDAGPAVLNVLGYRLLQAGLSERATEIFEANLKFHPSYLNGFDSLAEAYVAAGRRDDAASLYRELLQRLPGADLPGNLGGRLRTNAELFLLETEHFEPPSPEAIHVAAFYGGVPAAKWEIENLAAWKKRAGVPMSFDGHNLYFNPSPQGVEATLETEPRADVSTSFLGGEYLRWVEDGTIADISHLWKEQAWDDAFPAPFKRMATVGGKQYFVPTAFQWNPIWYRRDIFDELGLTPPETWAELLELCERLHEAGHAAFSIGVRGWPPPTARWFSILNLRLNGPEFHERLTKGTVPFTDLRVRSVFEHWQQLFDHNAFADSSFANTYQMAIDDLVAGRAVMYNLGEWIYESLPDGYDNLDFFAMPVMNPDVASAEIVHAYGAFMRSGSRHADSARQLLAYLGSRESQTSNAKQLRRINAHSAVDRTLYTDVQKRALEYLTNEVDVFVPLLEMSMKPEMADAALQTFVAFWEDPSDIDTAIDALETARREAYASEPLGAHDPVYQEIMRLERERMDAYISRDGEVLEQGLAEEYVHTNLRGGTTTRAEELAFYSSDDFSLDSGQVSDFVMHRYGDVLTATGRVTWRGARFRQADLSGDFRVTRVYVYRDDRWQLAASHASRIGG